MKASQLFIKTYKEEPQEATMSSHKLMLRAGLIKKLGSGLYAWMPLGKKVLNKVTAIIEKHMQAAGALEICLPTVQAAELWKETNRWQEYGPTLLKMKDRHEREFCYAPTHEEVITAIIREDINSYKQLPITLYQINTKFRDEIRPRFGVMRAREFVMKDAYSFAATQEQLDATYQTMFNTYINIFQDIGLKVKAVEADSGNIGGNLSHEFQALSESGEDKIAYVPNSDYAANLELAPVSENYTTSPATQSLETVEAAGTTTISKQANIMNLSETQILKTLLVKGESEDNPVVALLLRGDHILNPVKASKHPLVSKDCELIDEKKLEQEFGCKKGFIGPIGLNIPIIADLAVIGMSDFSCGANSNDKHYIGVNWERDLPKPEIFDLREIIDGDLAPNKIDKIEITKGIEVGHIFQLKDKYSKAMRAQILNKEGKPENIFMGCYGIGVSRIVAAAIEQNHDEKGIIWPKAIAPFEIVIIPIGYKKSDMVKNSAEKLLLTLNSNKNVILDDRNLRPGVMFSDWELIGIPYQIVISEKTLADNKVEVKNRINNATDLIDIDMIEKSIL